MSVEKIYELCPACGKSCFVKVSEWEPSLGHLSCDCGAYSTIELPDGHVHTMPNDKNHNESERCWCNPELIDDFTSTGGKKHFLHREIQ